MAYKVEGIPEPFYTMEKKDYRTRFAKYPDWRADWDPWASDEDALELLAYLDDRNVPHLVQEWSPTTTYYQMAQPAQAAIDRYGLTRRSGKTRTLYGYAVGRHSRLAIAPTRREAICRAVQYALSTGVIR